MKRFLVVALIVISFVRVGAGQENNSKGILLLEDTQFAKARDYFSGRVKAEPANSRLFAFLGDAYIGLQKLDSARMMYQKAIDLDPKSPFGYVGIGKLALIKGDKVAQNESFEKAKKCDKKNPEVYYQIIKGCYELGKLDTVCGNSYLAQGFEVNGKYAPLHIMAGDYDAIKKKFGDAVNAYERAIFFDANNYLAYRKLGILHTAARSMRDALTSLNKSLQLNSDQIMIQKNLGDYYYIMQKYVDAEKFYATYMSKAEYTQDDKERYAIILFFNKKYKEASALLEDVLNKDANQSVLMRIQGYIAYETGDFAKGIDYMNKFFKTHNPDNYIALDFLYYGRLLQKTGVPDQAIVNLKKAVALDSTKVEVYEDLAKLYNDSKMYVDAVGCYKKMIENGGDQVNLTFTIGKQYYFEADKYRVKFDSLMALQKENKYQFTDSTQVKEAKMLNFQRADSAFNVVTRLSPNYAGGFIWKGRMQSQIDPEAFTTNAKDAYEKALALLEAGDQAKNKKSIIECYRYLGSYYFLNAERLPKSEKAQSESLKNTSIDYFRKIIQLDPTDAVALQVFKTLKIQP